MGNISVVWKFGLPLLALLITGCGGLVYKDAATSYVVAGRAATKSVGEASAGLANSLDDLKAAKVVSDPSCPIEDRRIFVRDPKYRGVFTESIKRIPGMSPAGDCSKLIKCEANPAASECKSACFSGVESNCIVQIEANTSLTAKTLSGDAAAKYVEESRPLARALNATEYGRVAPVQNLLIDTSLKYLLEYLDNLDKLTTKRDSEAAEDFKKFADGITKASAQIQNASGKKLADADKKMQDQITGAIGALGKFADDATVIAQNWQDATAIKRLVVDRGADVKNLINTVKLVAVSDAQLATVYGDLGNMQTRKDIQDRYSTARDSYERRLVLMERNKAAYGKGGDLQESIGNLFDAMNRSHDALVQLVKNPDDKDRQKIANQRFQEFKLIASDIVTLVQQFH